jgi:hypothetical protein
MILMVFGSRIQILHKELGASAAPVSPRLVLTHKEPPTQRREGFFFSFDAFSGSSANRLETQSHNKTQLAWLF